MYGDPISGFGQNPGGQTIVPPVLGAGPSDRSQPGTGVGVEIPGMTGMGTGMPPGPGTTACNPSGSVNDRGLPPTYPKIVGPDTRAP